MVEKSILPIKAAREIRLNFRQYISVILIAALAVTLFTGLLANYENFKARLTEIYAVSDMCDGIIMVSNDADKDEIREKLDGYESLEYGERLFLPAKISGRSVYIATFKEGDKFNKPYSHENPINDDGAYSDSGFSKSKELEVGKPFYVDATVMGMDLSVPLTFSGNIVHPESLENSEYNPVFIYVGENALIDGLLASIRSYYGDNIFTSLITRNNIEKRVKNAYNQFLLKGDDAQAAISAINAEYQGTDALIYALPTAEIPTNITVETDVNQAKGLIYIFPVIFYLVALLIILTSISQLIGREQKNIGILKALGYSNAEILLHYTSIFVALSAIGSIIGIIAGPLIIPQVMGKKYSILYQLPDVNLPFFRPEYLFSVLILIVITFITGLFACYEALKMRPAQSLRGVNAFNMKPLKDSKKDVKPVFLPVKMAFRNMRRKVSRTIMVVAGTMGCSALLLCGFGIENTLDYGIDLELNELIPYSVTVTYTENVSKKSEIEKIEGVKSVDEFAKYSVNLQGGKVVSSYVFILPENPTVFNFPYGDESCIISSTVAEDVGVKKGDTVSFVYGEKSYSAIITEVRDFCVSQGIFVSVNKFENLPFTPTGAYIKSTDDSYNNSISEAISSLNGILTSASIEDMRIRADGLLSTISVMTNTIKIFAILLAIVVLYNLALLNFKERTKDIATLKVLGFSKFAILSSFIIEILFLTFLGSLIGLTLGFPLMKAVLMINQTPLCSYIYHIYVKSYIYTVLLTCGVSLIINLFFGFLTDKVPMAESLKSVE
ncbi:MAG: FtsX-like permease family protein [Clostridia bacterium]|nr:FtsX-like permease family protein [Clostridia bacterium]